VLAAVAAALAFAAPGDVAYNVAVSIARAGSRPAGSANERRAHERMVRRFRRAGLRVRVQRFATAHGRSRNVIGVLRGEPACRRVLMAHTDSMPAGPGAEDNASGVGVLAGLADRLDELDIKCETWFVATGAEEGGYTGSPDHLGSLALTRELRGLRVRWALSLDEVGRGSRFLIRSPVSAPRRGVERELMAAGRAQDVSVAWRRDDGLGHSDHREIELYAKKPGMKLGVYGNACRHQACDTADRLERAAFRRVQRVVETVIQQP
jgi:Peptidase family M28